jgi:hypothetical protein
MFIGHSNKWIERGINKMELMQIIKELFVHRVTPVAHFNPQVGKWMPKISHYSNNKPTYLSYDESLLLAHIAGTMKLGLYSTDTDSSCRWVVADFDDNAFAFHHCITLRNKLAEYSIGSFIERSASGNGYHLWLFFKNPVHSAVARRIMLNALRMTDVPITGKMKKGGNQARSMDRLFPAQDYLPRDGFGNLVCVPFHGVAMEQQNTKFIDDDKNPYPDQFAYITQIYNEHRIDHNGSNVQELLAVDPPIIIEKSINEEDIDQWMNVGQFSVEERVKAMGGCEAIKAGINNANQFNEPSWQAVISNIAIYGSGALEFAHEFSRGYDMSQADGDASKVYSKDDTDRKFYKKLDHIQRGGIPTTCRRMSEDGWDCPKLNTCDYRFIAHFGLPPSESLYSSEYPVSMMKREWIRYVEELGFYGIFKAQFVPTPKIYLFAQATGQWFPPGERAHEVSKYNWRDMNEFDIARHLFYQPMKIQTFDPKTRSSAFALKKFESKKSMSKFVKSCKQYKLLYFVETHPLIFNQYSVWLLFDRPFTIKEIEKVIGRLMMHCGLSDVSYTNYVIDHDDGFVVAPFSHVAKKNRFKFIEYLVNRKGRLAENVN